MEVRIWRYGQEHLIRFRDGEAEAPLRVIGPSEHPSGTEVTFKPSPVTFTKTDFDFVLLERRLRELAFLNSGLAIKLCDERHAPAQAVEMRYDGGLVAFVEWLEAFTMPTLVVCGDKDDDNGSAEELANVLPNAVFHEVPGTHMSSVTRPEFGEAIARFLATP